MCPWVEKDANPLICNFKEGQYSEAGERIGEEENEFDSWGNSGWYYEEEAIWLWFS